VFGSMYKRLMAKKYKTVPKSIIFLLMCGLFEHNIVIPKQIGKRDPKGIKRSLPVVIYETLNLLTIKSFKLSTKGPRED